MRRLIATTLMLLGLAPVAQTQAQDTFRFTAIPDEDQTRLVERFQKVADYLADTLDVDVEYVPVKSYSAAVSAFRNDQVQLAWFGGLSGVQARRLVPGSQALAQGVEDAAFHSYFIANADTGIAADQDQLPESFEGHSFTFGAKTSTSGRLMPEYYLRERFGEAPEALFSRVGFSGDHTRTIALVESGTYDVGAVNYSVWNAAVEAGRVDTDKVHVVWETPAYPDYQWTIRGDVDARFGDGFTDRVRQALLGMTDPDLLESFPRQGFIPVSNDAYAPIETVGEDLGLLR
ncbi:MULTISPECIES: putative selenate ABC transporter substrate-binding protein [Modicisalibacter]|uniref:Selenate ABC transporter substrate-binding protein n=1 Tax=Modicisalibacter tunisiensis TaxID=390637 RepID=A0ABS7X3Y1_9GAMM|nr:MULTISPECIES: putative selenate ABC transporter substrate-binding protein [Modicisalibacter]MBZ9569168.1 putative selenate ABC transporter substrate-binding protein [Modicisalibacter tunisiensis]